MTESDEMASESKGVLDLAPQVADDNVITSDNLVSFFIPRNLKL